MLRRHAALILAITLIALVATACLVRTGPRRNRNSGPVYRSAPAGDHRKGKQKKHKHKGRGRDLQDDNAPRDP